MRKINIIPWLIVVLMYIILCSFLILSAGTVLLKQYKNKIQSIEKYINGGREC